jgi:hypothetical protein
MKLAVDQEFDTRDWATVPPSAYLRALMLEYLGLVRAHATDFLVLALR